MKMKKRTFKCAGSNYVVARGTISQAKKELKKEAKENINYLKDIQRDVGLTTKQKQKMIEFKRIVKSC